MHHKIGCRSVFMWPLQVFLQLLILFRAKEQLRSESFHDLKASPMHLHRANIMRCVFTLPPNKLWNMSIPLCQCNQMLVITLFLGNLLPASNACTSVRNAKALDTASAFVSLRNLLLSGLKALYLQR